MGYEQFVRKIFPFVGNQYNIADEEKKSEKKTLIVTLEELINKSKGTVVDFARGKLLGQEEVADPSSVLNHFMFMPIVNSPETVNDFDCMYLVDPQTAYVSFEGDFETEDSSIAAIFGKEAPYTFHLLTTSEGAPETLEITPDMLGLKYVKFIKLDDTQFVIEYELGENLKPTESPENTTPVEESTEPEGE